MKKTLSALVITLLLINPVLATSIPTVNDIVSPIDAGKYTITGTAEPGAKITITGGPYELSPIYADDSTGYWEKTVTLSQETDNNFSITAVGTDEETSEAVHIVIVEGQHEAESYEEITGEDRTAPNAPSVDTPTSPVDADTAIIKGVTESHITISISGADIVQTTSDSAGSFSVQVDLSQNTNNIFYVSAIDGSNNMSSSTRVEIDEISAEEETEANDQETEVDNLEITFPDIDEHWGQTYIEELATDGVVNGYDNGTFGPDNYITRAEITKIALNAFDYEVNSTDEAFTDLEEGAWYVNYVNVAAKFGIINGYDDGTFAPNQYVNRAEALKVLFEASGVAEMAGAHIFLGSEDSWENPFPDVTDDAWYYEYLMQAYTAEILSGYVDGTFGPANNITRAEVCKIVLNLIELKQAIVATPTI
ncbi:MAG: S-layer homology domain-containing protein [Patescibacteria group bacterium]|nr:S-layer homology domain-containing protein [Patescibacteria group bacterium]